MDELILNDLRTDVNQLFVQEALSVGHLNALSSVLLGVIKETLPEERAKQIRSIYLDLLEECSNEALDALKDIVDDQALLRRQKFELFSRIRHLRDSAGS